ncbi:3-oxoacyl-ACP synthase [Solibacillus isronensis]|uniref:3-oxoacyl-ACP synthase n=1 Tax=Solibacillus isronensis TaxID=412383 RepID=UPI0020402266|nr:3-oxoacyl-ACP synthase [Solibacillus isronensis]MCM3723178.1 3-oxoacyl-ACP synthase [Solibacillus isronensis]
MIGITGLGMYLPEGRMTGAQIAEKANIPTAVVETKMGIIEKVVAGPNDHPVEMSVKAAKEAISEAQVDAKDIDVVIYIGEEHKEYPLWTAAIKIQEEIGAVNAWAFDVQLRCGTAIMAMKVAKSLMLADDSVKTVLLAGGYRNHDFIDYENERTRFMFNLGAGAGAMILQKNAGGHEVLEASLITDGSFSGDVVVPVGGTKEPLTVDHIQEGRYILDVLDPEGMKLRLEQKSLSNFLKVIRQSLQKSGYSDNNLHYVAMLHMKKSAHDYVLKELGLSEENSIYLSHYGHIGQIDQILSLCLARKEGKLQQGQIVSLVSAGIGYAWGAITVKWGV